jgi:iron-sulfur cluster repair protein YtfE (RIC family)
MPKQPLPDIAPERWHEHPAWTRQAYDALVGFHDRYRRETSRLVAAAADEQITREELLRDCTTLEDRLHTHEAVEEQGLYPFIEQRFDVELEPLRLEHQELNSCIDKLKAMLATPGIERHLLRRELARLDQTLREHLRAEEAVCVPALLAISAADFHTLTGD